VILLCPTCSLVPEWCYPSVQQIRIKRCATIRYYHKRREPDPSARHSCGVEVESPFHNSLQRLHITLPTLERFSREFRVSLLSDSPRNDIADLRSAVVVVIAAALVAQDVCRSSKPHSRRNRRPHVCLRSCTRTRLNPSGQPARLLLVPAAARRRAAST